MQLLNNLSTYLESVKSQKKKKKKKSIKIVNINGENLHIFIF